MRCFSTFRARLGVVPSTLPLMAAAWLVCACDAGSTPAGAGTSDALKGGIPAHADKAKSNQDQHGEGDQAGSMAQPHDDDAGVDEGGEHGKGAAQHGKLKKPKKHDQDSGVDEDQGSDEDDQGDDESDEH